MRAVLYTGVFAIIAAILTGWAINIHKLYLALSAGIDAAGASEVLRALGVVVVPLGGILGWI